MIKLGPIALGDFRYDRPELDEELARFAPDEGVEETWTVEPCALLRPWTIAIDGEKKTIHSGQAAFRDLVKTMFGGQGG